ncbi:MAG TPA: winged helix-turn-helix transcriptional regulator [Candidatus Thermoplasmatota archaeon]|nr:winged helix-turn-helix transcriptional regulator [Candidatus Thermoplasmatota archaeon]
MPTVSKWGLALLLLLPALASAVAPPDLAASAGAAGLNVRLDPGASDVSGYLVVSHQDPLDGAVVDRVIPVDTPAGIPLNLTIDQLRSDVNVSVALLDQVSLDGLLTNASSLLNGSLLASLPLIGEANVGSLLPTVAPFDLHAYPYADLSRDIRHPRVLANSAGVLAVAYLATFGEGWLGEPIVRLSRDGGHRFEDPIQLMPGETVTTGGSDDGFSSEVSPDGTFLFVASHDDSGGHLERVTVARLDPVTGAITKKITQVPAEGRFSANNYLPVILDDGTVLVIGSGAVGWYGLAGPTVLRLAPDGTVQSTALETVSGLFRPGGIRAFSGPHGAAAVAWPVGNQNAPGSLRYVTTYDGGRTWAAPRNLTGMPAGAMGYRGTFDDLGTMHLAVTTWYTANMENSTMRYFQVPRIGAPRIASLPWLGDPIKDISEPSIASSGGRVWILATVRTTKDPVADANGFVLQPRTVAWESLPDPLGLRAPYQFKVTGAYFYFDEGTPALLPDGRLVVTGISGGRAVVPLFDPFPEPACATYHPAATPNYTGPPSAVQTCGDKFSFLRLPGGVTLAPFTSPILGATPIDAAHPRLEPSRPVAAPLPPLPALATGAAVVAGAAGVASLAMTDAVRYGTGLLLSRLFSRVQGKQALQNPIRGGLHDHITANPGIRFNRLRKDLGLSHGATAYHLQVLERSGLVQRRSAWTTRHYYTVDGAPPLPAPAANDAILDFVRKNPGAGAAEVGRHLGLSRQLAHYHLRRLAAAGRMSAAPGPARRP